ncbi:MAG: hypothetical protein P9X22_02180 [Candidatus Zapsychrus exili]|nr:hypothetical protein [Candidatus Zapsychrus exili]
MENSVFLAKLIGPYCIIVGLGVLLNLKTYQTIMEDFLKNSALIYLGGILALIIGLLIVLTHNVWTVSWAVAITIFGWGGIIKGIWLIAFPKSICKFSENYLKNANLLKLHLILVIIVGVGLSIFGYIG